MAESYYTVLTAAINDLVENGYDSVERIAYWSKKIEEAANSQLGSVYEAEVKLREALASSYKKIVDQGTVLRRHPGVSAFDLQRISPELRKELDRRILAATDLIRTNREEAVGKTLHRFRAWSTSIPAGGTPTAERTQTKALLKKSLQELPYEDRRLAIDQSHKLASSISSIIALENGALAGIWRSHWRQAGYQYREDHKHRDDEVYPIRDNWALAKGFMKKAGQPFTDEIESPGEWPFCRCYYTWIYSLNALPGEFLTKSGEAALALAKRRILEL